MMYSHLSVAVPALDELDNMPIFIEQLRRQTYREFSLYVCVNQPDAWWQGSPEQQRVCQANASTIDILYGISDMDVHIVDRSSEGKGWTPKRQGVGWARKEIFGQIMEDNPSGNELIVSLDADTAFGCDYLQQVVDSMNKAPEACALAVPYYHPLSGIDVTDRAMLRYECYMRHYLIHLLEIHNPYAFSALGSAMVFPLWAYRRVGGITPLQGGEDFYLMQKFCKTGKIALHADAVVYPQGRISHRVPFGTGPAIASQLDVQSQKYPFFSPEGFARVAQTYAMLPDLYEYDQDTPMTHFMQQQMKTADLWGPLRKNFKTRDRFVNACQERLDGLRILQFLKLFPMGEEFFAPFLDARQIRHAEELSFANSAIADLDQVRQSLYALELRLRAEHDA